MYLLSKDNVKEHCRTCLKRLKDCAPSTSDASNTDETLENKDLYVNIYSNAELQQLILIYVDDQTKRTVSNSIHDDFPENVCLPCFDKLNSFNVFRRRAVQSAEKLRTVLNCKSGMIKVEINNEEDKAEILTGPLESKVTDHKQEFKDTLLESERVFLGTSIANLSDIELNDAPVDPFSPSSPSISDCSSKEVMKNEAGLIENEKPSTKYELFKCTECSQSYTRKSELESHVHETHTKSECSLPFSCGHCDKAYRFVRSLEEHVKNKHQAALNAYGQFKCNVCPRAFLTDFALKKHMCSHIREDMARICGICSKRFPAKNLLIAHLRTHSKEGRIPCGKCDKSFLWHQDLLNHEIAAHRKEKPFTCKVCEKPFQTRKSLRFHSFCHSGLKPYLCEVCGKDFRQPSSMKQHWLGHFKHTRNEKS